MGIVIVFLILEEKPFVFQQFSTMLSVAYIKLTWIPFIPGLVSVLSRKSAEFFQFVSACGDWLFDFYP